MLAHDDVRRTLHVSPSYEGVNYEEAPSMLKPGGGAAHKTTQSNSSGSSSSSIRSFGSAFSPYSQAFK